MHSSIWFHISTMEEDIEIGISDIKSTIKWHFGGHLNAFD